MKIKSLILALLAGIVVSGAVQATIIDHGDYLTDSATGLDWLDVTKTVSVPYNVISSQLGSGGTYEGWRYASGNELNTLISNYTGIAINSYWIADQEPNRIDGLIQLLGSTQDAAYLIMHGVTYDEYFGFVPGGRLYYTLGLLSDSEWVHLNFVSEKYQYAGYLYDLDMVDGIGDVSITHSQHFKRSESIIDLGSFLVRNSSVVPEPTTIALLGSGLLGIVMARRKPKHYSSPELGKASRLLA